MSLTSIQATDYIIEKLGPSDDGQRALADRVRKRIAYAVKTGALVPRGDRTLERAGLDAWAQSKKNWNLGFPGGGGGAVVVLQGMTASAGGFESPTSIEAGQAMLIRERERSRQLEIDNGQLRATVAKLRPLEDAATEKSRKAAIAGKKGGRGRKAG
jgi:hypothetical protein